LEGLTVSMSRAAASLRWGVTRRMEFLEQRLFWEGRANRADLIRVFRVSVPQASADLSQYQAMAPGNVEYDRSGKTYLATARFAPVFGVPTADSYLSRLRVDEAGEGGDVRALNRQDFVVVPQLKRRVDAETLRKVVQAIRGRKRIRVQYQSMSSEELAWRWMVPHGLAFDGQRWHARAYCEVRAEFRDFVLSRMFDVGEEQSTLIVASCDMEWTNQVTLRLAPNPKLSEGIRRGLEREYDMKDGAIEVVTPVCMAFYLGKEFGLDNPEKDKDPARFQIVVANVEELKKAKNGAEAETRKALEALREIQRPEESVMNRQRRGKRA
jgi:hypothetical protein